MTNDIITMTKIFPREEFHYVLVHLAKNVIFYKVIILSKTKLSFFMILEGNWLKKLCRWEYVHGGE